MREALLAAAGGLLLAGCPGPPNPCKPYQSSANLTQPVTSFSSAVLPVFQASCSLPSCHSSAVMAGGMSLQGSSPSAIRAAIVGKPSGELPAMSLVIAGDPAQSYLMHKMDGDSCALPSCDGGLCAASMPQAQGLLSTDTRDIVRRWIAQGAVDN